MTFEPFSTFGPYDRLKCAARALLVVAALGAACSRAPDTVIQRHLDRAARYTLDSKHAEAIIEYKNALQVDGRRSDVRLKLADSYLAVGDLSNGLREYVRASDLAPHDIALQLKAGNLLLLARRFDDAKVRAEKVIAKDPHNVDAQIVLANALAGLQDFDAAVSQIEDAIKANPDRGVTYANLGAFELRRGNVPVAEKAFKRAVELDPKSSGAHVALANFYWAKADWPVAERELVEALRLDPNNALFNRALANFYYASKRPQEAEAPLKKVLEITKSPAAALALADYYVAIKNDAAAAAVLQPLLGENRDSVQATVRLATIDYRQGRRGVAYDRLEAVLEKDPGNLQALLVKAAALADEGKLADALSVATIAATRHPDSTAAAFAVGRIQVARRQPEAAVEAFEKVLQLNPRATDAKIALARLNLAQGRADASVGLAQEAVTTDPDNGMARLELVRALIARGDLDQAATQLEALVKRFPDSAAVHNQKGFLLGRKGQGAAARAEFERAQQLEPASLEALAGLVALDLAGRNFAVARERVTARLKDDDRNPALLLLAARTAAAAGDLAAAEQHLLHAIDVDPAQLPAYGALGQLYIAQRRLDSARKQFEALAEKSRNPVGALTILGMLQQVQGDLAGARARYERVLEIDANAPVAANNLAYMYAEAGEKLDIALQLAQVARRRLPDVPDVGDTLGFVYYRKDLAPLAVSTLAPVVAAEPNNAMYQFHLGLAYAKAGDARRARTALARALQLKKDFAGAAEAAEMLKQLPTQ